MHSDSGVVSSAVAHYILIYSFFDGMFLDEIELGSSSMNFGRAPTHSHAFLINKNFMDFLIKWTSGMS